mmetsp:Transcript_8283/g.6176  ORF Transcript_8283/g.6176 Transcript_8283/m.6176 type:complete len:112 (+) Transcript_8283:135-470(+)
MSAFTNNSEKLALYTGYVLAASFGVVTPIYVIFQGAIVNSLDGSVESTMQIIDYCLILIYISLFGFVVSAIYFILLESVGQKVAIRMRTKYLKATLNQEMQWFEENNSLEL